MTYKSCPTAIVNAPIEVVWEILTEPAAWGAFFDVRIIDVQPKGSALVGQRIYAESGPRFLRLRLKFQFTEVNTVEHKLRLNIELPFSISVREDLNCIPLSCTQCRVYHTYSAYARGLDGLWGMYQWLDRAPRGRNETGVWFRRHDEY
jgi:hypothetical protein